MKKLPLIGFLLLFCTALLAQITPNEKLVYAASYKMSGIMTNLAQVTLQTKTVQTSKKTFLHLSMQASTYSKWDSYFKIRDLYESYVNPQTFEPSMYKRNVAEGTYTKTEKYTYSADRRTITSVSKRKTAPERTATFSVGSSSMDIVTALYKVRTYDFSKYKEGQSIPITIIFDEKEFPANIKYMGKETISVASLGKKECYKLSVSAKTDVLKGQDKNLVWITADARRIPVRMEFSIPVGVGQLTLSSAN